ncbi:hypothetical protein FN846DRAFT_904182 [Sphaerosporella brunnea]|uniref:Uncharacterized protein n=1 Tax=Sphaerosporella brunnea TaxID=1250544 RepID=A0A5J5F4Y1_9PEZI|nr:hypothetical protein FN846DRAFT_904182 [Sphaerosporella brunnea]
MDIAATFPSAARECLLRKMQNMQLDENLVAWTDSLMQDSTHGGRGLEGRRWRTEESTSHELARQKHGSGTSWGVIEHLRPYLSWSRDIHYLGTSKDGFDSEIYAIYPAIHCFYHCSENGQAYNILADAQAALERRKNDSMDPGQWMAHHVVKWSHELVTYWCFLTLRSQGMPELKATSLPI